MTTRFPGTGQVDNSTRRHLSPKYRTVDQSANDRYVAKKNLRQACMQCDATDTQRRARAQTELAVDSTLLRLLAYGELNAFCLSSDDDHSRNSTLVSERAEPGIQRCQRS